MMAQQLLLVSPAQQSLSQLDSLALVQIFLNASLACISHTRELVPWTSVSFRTRYINDIEITSNADGRSLYETFLNPPSEDLGRGQEIRTLVRGGHRRADQVLDMLEQGVFEALEHGYLETLQVFVIKNPEDCPVVLENYCFTFAYDHGRVNSVQLSATKKEFLLEDVHRSFKTAIRALLRMLRDMPRVTSRRKLGMSLTYNNACPTIYQPPGFVDRERFKEGDGDAICDALILPDAEDVIVGRLDTGHHQVQVGVRLQQSGDAGPSPNFQDTAMSKQLQAMQKTSSIRSTNLISTLRDSGSGAKRHLDAPLPKAKRLEIFDPRKLLSEVQEQDADVEEQSVGSRDLGKPVLGTREPWSDPEPSKDTVGPFLDPSKLAELLVHCYALQCGLDCGPGGVFDQVSLTQWMIKRHFRSTEVTCECGSQHTSSVMLFCEVCDGWQHGECYGRDNTSHAMMGEHFCYTCLLFPGEQPLENSSSFIIFMRRAVKFLTTEMKPGMPLEDTFLPTIFKDCRWTGEVLNMVQSRLLEEGLLVDQGQHRFQVMALGEARLSGVTERYLSTKAGLGDLYTVFPIDHDLRHRADEIEVAMQEYARGRNFTAAQGCRKMISFNNARETAVRWGYLNGSDISMADTSPPASRTETPGRRRKISISRMLINIDRSPSVGSVCFDESSGRLPRDFSHSTDLVSDASTASVD